MRLLKVVFDGIEHVEQDCSDIEDQEPFWAVWKEENLALAHFQCHGAFVISWRIFSALTQLWFVGKYRASGSWRNFSGLALWYSVAAISVPREFRRLVADAFSVPWRSFGVLGKLGWRISSALEGWRISSAQLIFAPCCWRISSALTQLSCNSISTQKPANCSETSWKISYYRGFSTSAHHKSYKRLRFRRLEADRVTW